jgi:hypothetical protein
MIKNKSPLFPFTLFIIFIILAIVTFPIAKRYSPHKLSWSHYDKENFCH